MSKNDLPVSVQPQVQSEEEESLKYLDVVEKAAKNVVPYASKAYDYAKDNSGSLKPAVETTEGGLKTLVGPAIDTFHDTPSNVLKFADRKAAESVSKAKSTSVASDIKNVGVVETASGLTKTAYNKIEPTAKELLVKYELVAEQNAASAWNSLNKVPLVSSMANAVVPTAAYVSDKYNQTVQQIAEEGYKDSSYLPRVPTEKIAKVFKAPETETEEEPEPVVPGGTDGAVGSGTR